MSAFSTQELLPIGLFDSGLGGLTVMQELAEILPDENIIYFADTARLPYGNKSPEAISQIAIENASFLMQQNIKLLIIACHTACTHAYEILKKTLRIPVIGLTNASILHTLSTTKTNSIAILGTQSTIEANLIQSILFSRQAGLDIHSIACPLFVPLIEEGFHNHPATKMIAEYYLSPLKKTQIDTILLACTHYPLLLPVLQAVVGDSIQLISPAFACALEARAFLSSKGLLNPGRSKSYHRFYTSDKPYKFKQLSNLFFSIPIEEVALVQNKIL